ncbi:PPE domain-containing protein [Saccharopolyspora sp. NPDC002686]|uniref:PPE domain-containing protein n=1 Tax=Saccharopolyspora sp. NPDC002686 TaxID=3154541 RepID=UPI00332639CC
MGAFDWLFGGRDRTGPGQVEFVHSKIYGEVKGGPGVDSLSAAGKSWMDVGTAFKDAAAALERVLKDTEVLMQGSAADQAREAVLPLAKATLEAADIAYATGVALDRQVDASSAFSFAFVPPHQVPPDNIGWSDYVNPVAFAAKSGVRVVHEDIRDQVAAHAQQQYEAYTQSTNERVSGLQLFAPPPKFTADVAAAETTPVSKVEPLSSHEDLSVTRDGTETSQLPASRTPADPVPVSESVADPVTADEQPPEDSMSEMPAEADSAWVPPVAGGNPMTGGSVPAPGLVGPGGGVVGGVVVPLGGAGDRAGLKSPSPGPGSGRGGGTGTGRGVPGKPGGGGRSGTGGGAPVQGTASAGGPAARGGSGGAAVGGPSSGGRGQREEEKEHGRKFVRSGKDAWEDLEIPKVAPPVFGDWEAEALRGKPPRPPEEK